MLHVVGAYAPTIFFYFGSDYMARLEQSSKNPMSEFLLKLQLIITNTEFMNKEEARKYETMDTKIEGTKYVNAVLGTDMFESYDWNTNYLRTALLELGYKYEDVVKYADTPEFIPYPAKQALLKRARARRIRTYQEPNKYYLNLMGVPMETIDPILTVPNDFVKTYQEDGTLNRDQPIHTMPKKYQELFMNSKYYKALLEAYPNVEYLKHIGSNAVPLEISRKAKDGDILLINTAKLQTYHETYGNVTVSADIVHEFTTTYKKVARYVYGTLRGDFQQIYPNYNSFIRLLVIYMTIGQCMNAFMKKSTKLIYMTNEIANDYFTLYGLPSVLMEMSSLVGFLKKFRQLLMDKGTNTVYRVKDLIGYETTDIYTLVMVKQQAFKDGYPLYTKDPETGKLIPQQDIVFRRMGTTDDNVSYFQFKNSTKEYPWQEIASGDPRWWDTAEVRRMIQEMNYTLSNSKYIQLSTTMDMDDIWWQCCILLRGLLDHRKETMYTELAISQSLGGQSSISLFEAVLLLIIMMNWNHTDFRGRYMSGGLYLPNGTINGTAACLDLLFNGLQYDGTPNPLKLGGPYKLSSFNFDLKSREIEKYRTLSTYAYLEPDVLMPMLDRIMDREDTNIAEVLMSNVKNVFVYLETKLRTASTIHEFRQVTDAYNWLFLVDPVRDWSDSTSYDTDELLVQSYGITLAELNVLKYFFYGDETDNSKIKFTYLNTSYAIPVYDVLNKNVLSLPYPFDNQEFVKAFNEATSTWKSSILDNAEIANDTIRLNYQSIIQDKVLLDVSGSQYGPTSFEALLYRENPKVYRALQLMKGDGDQLLILMRSIIRALEVQTNSSLSALEFEAVGQKEYIRILKEVITYFKSYMVEFTKEEFQYIFGGLFDHGGNSNMLALFDEINHVTIRVLPKDALHLYDVSYADARVIIKDDVSKFFYDDAIFRIRATYKKLKELGYEMWFDNDEYIDQAPFEGLKDEDLLIAEFLQDPSGTYKIIINGTGPKTTQVVLEPDPPTPPTPPDPPEPDPDPIDPEKVTLIRLDDEGNLTDDINYFTKIHDAKEYMRTTGRYNKYAMFIGRLSGVTEIPAKEFSEVSQLVSVEIPETITTLGTGCFQHCENLESIKVSVTDIPEMFAASCNLTELTMLDGVKTIGSQAFHGCPIQTLTIPDSVESIGPSAFGACKSLKSVTFGSGLQSIGNSAFVTCESLESLDIPGNVETIGQSAFTQCYSLKEVTLHDGLISLGTYVFSVCRVLGPSITIPSTVQEIGNYTFSSCSALKTITINKPQGDISGARWSAPNATVIWTG